MAAATPMMAQYLKLKEEAGTALLFYRMGDFYELFFEDATAAAATLSITLTRRGQHLGEEVPMCGVPVHAAAAYVARLVRAGHRVAIAEQTEDPAIARRENRPLARAIVRVVTPATLTEDDLLDPRAANWLAVAAPSGSGAGGMGLAFADISTGRFHAMPVAPGRIDAELARLQPAEIVMPEGADGVPAARPFPALHFRETAARARLCERFGVLTLDGFGAFTLAEVAAMGALIAYLDQMSGAARPRLDPPTRLDADGVMAIDPASRASLGLGADGLLGAVDRTVTASGARALAADLAAPFTDRAAIQARHALAESFVHNPALRQRLRALLKAAPDIERPLARAAVGRASPRDLGAIGAGLSAALGAKALLADVADPPPLLSELAGAVGDHAETAALMATAFGPEPIRSLAEGGFIAPGFDPALDELRTAAVDGRRMIAALEARYRAETGVTALKLRHNAVLGYHVDAPSRADATLREAGFVHRQTLAGAVRFGTPELAELAETLSGASDAALACETAHFEALRARVHGEAAAISATAQALARIDVAAGWAELAAAERWVRPELTDGADFEIEGGRHPVVEAALRSARAPFVANDCRLSAQPLWLVTGPNMGGKSTFLRQNALIAILAQAGGFVPAKAARLGIVDRLFSRVGASDDLASGRSTFMVEMVETAAILRQATARSLVILDEVGRGTSTYDGLAIAWAVVEWVHDRIGCRCLFATHYHELTRLAERLEGMRNVNLRAREWRGDLVFLHEVADGAADRSYGLSVAKLAGVPEPVLARAKAVLGRLEAGRPTLDLSMELPLFAAAGPVVDSAAPADPLREALRGVEPDDLTPREALALVVELKGLV